MSNDPRTPVPLRPTATLEEFRESRRQRHERLRELMRAGDPATRLFMKLGFGVFITYPIAIIAAAPSSQSWVVTAASIVVWILSVKAMPQIEDAFHKHTFGRNIASLAFRSAVFAILVTLVPQQGLGDLGVAFYAWFAIAVALDLGTYLVAFKNYEHLSGYTWKKSRAAAPADLEKTAS